MYSRDKMRQQIIRYYLRELYPVFYPETHIQAVLHSIEQCTNTLELNRILLSPAFVREERLWQAYFEKRNQLVPPEQRRWRIAEQKLWPLPGWMRELLIDCIKSFVADKEGRQPISTELYLSIQACNSLQELSALVHSLTLTRLQEIDAVEKRLWELPQENIVPPPTYTAH
jgi:hypothetical protein